MLRRCDTPCRQRGIALLVMLALLGIAISALLVNGFSLAALHNLQDQHDAAILAQAKAALIGRAARDDNRPGSLPCPDLVTNIANNIPNDGAADLFAGSHCPSYVGRLPWKTLGLPDLRDSAGERLWYALSSSFRDNNAAHINSDTPGTLAVSGDGAQDHIVAIVFAPGPALAGQVRSSANLNQVANYLEADNANGDTLFQTASAASNDRLLALTGDSLLAVVEKRVAKAALNCLKDYAALSFARYPWAAPLAPSAAPSYQDRSGQLFGRIASDLGQTQADSGNQMTNSWPATSSCNASLHAAWWNDWREQVFYALAESHQPLAPPSTPAAGNYLTVDPPSASADKKVIVFVAGKTLPSQSRNSNSDKASIGNYLEGTNAGADMVFGQHSISADFNDTLAYQ